MRFSKWSFWLVLLLLAVLGGAGCKTTEPDNASTRPWNAPSGWQNGLPSSMYQGR